MDNQLYCAIIDMLNIIDRLRVQVGRANAIPATKNYASEVFALGILAGVNQPDVQWASLVLEEPPR